MYATVTMDADPTFDTWDAAQRTRQPWRRAALDTLIGPVSAQIAFNKDGGSRFYF